MPLYDRAEAQASQAENLELTKLNLGAAKYNGRGRKGQPPPWFIDFNLTQSALKRHHTTNSLTNSHAKIWIGPKNGAAIIASSHSVVSSWR